MTISFAKRIGDSHPTILDRNMIKQYIKPQIVVLRIELESVITAASISMGTPGANPAEALAPEVDLDFDEDDDSNNFK